MKTTEASPITEIRLGIMNQQDAGKLGEKLKKEKCRMTYVSEGHYCLVRFPSGSAEKQHTDPDPRYREETIITLPGGIVLRKVLKWPCRRAGCTHTYLFLPGEAEETPLRRRLQHETR